MVTSQYDRGSEWRKWDLHIHTPASFHWDGEKLSSAMNSPADIALIDEMIDALNAAEPAVFAIMDYWTFDGWFALKNRLSQPNAPKLEKTVFPGIELRLMSPMKERLNAHVLFSDKITDQELRDFKSNLLVEFPGSKSKKLSNDALIEYARFVQSEKLKYHALDEAKVHNDDSYALEAGSKIAEISCESYKNAISELADNKAIGFMPFDTSDGLTGIKRNEHYAYVLGLFKTSPIFETRDIDLWTAFSGIKTEKNSKWFDNFQIALNNIPRLAVSGSDAHRFIGEAGNNDKRGYGDYPSDKITWIKADPTFEGLLQAIKEPAKRSFIGKQPPKVKLFNENKSFFLDKLEINKTADSTLTDEWLNNTQLNLNSDLVAIIGNKGNGKSALADIIALLGNSKQSQHFSFLKTNRFRGKTGEPAKYFTAKSTWCDGTEQTKNLNEDPATESVEFVKYIPQGHFEELCNAHVSGKSDAFEKELRSVIFSHTEDTIRLGALDFDQLIEQQEGALQNRIDGIRNELKSINKQITSIEEQMLPEKRKQIEELLTHKHRLIEEHNKVKPEEVIQPTNKLSHEQQEASKELDEISKELEINKTKKENNDIELKKLAEKRKAALNVLEGISIVKRSAESFIKSFKEDAELVGLNISEIIKIEINEQLISDAKNRISESESELRAENQKIEEQNIKLIKRRTPLSANLDLPQKKYQDYLIQLKEWKEKRAIIFGNSESPDTLEGLKHRKEQLDRLPERRNSLQDSRLEKTSEIFDLLDEKRSNREKLFQPIQELIHSNSLIRDEYKLQFKAELNSTSNSISNKLFSLVKQAVGEFRGSSESEAVIKNLVDKYHFNDKKSLLRFVNELYEKLENAAGGQSGIFSILRKDCTSDEVYDFIFSLDYLKPRYTLMFQDAEIGQLSPGQRGSLLLIFYLLVDKDSLPIILDQPEENLDNETIVSLLVPVLNEAKQKRQIIMVTHNPNLAVVCDAEQIIHCEIDRKNGHKIKYTSGSIECKKINRKVVDVLEGTMPAFENRRNKYHG